MISRRHLTNLLGSIGATISLTGCVDTRWWEDDDESKTGTNTPAGEGEGHTDEEPADSDESSVDTSDHDEEGTVSEDDKERQQEPTREETEIDRDEYEQQEVSDTEARSIDDVEIVADSQVATSGSATVMGTVTNVSETPIDVVDLEVVFYSADNEYLSAQLVTVTDLGVGESEQFETGITSDNVRGHPEHVEINPAVYDRVD